MSDTSQGPNWWLASDGKWYPPAPPPPPQAAGIITQPPPTAPSPYGYQVSPQKQTNGLAIVSFVLGLIWVAGIGSLLAVIFGFVSRTKIRQSQGQQSGDGLAIAGIVLGFVGIFGAIAFWIAIAALGTAVDSVSSYSDGFSYGTNHPSAVCNSVNVPSGDSARSWIDGCNAATSSSGNTGFGGNSGNTGFGGNS
jgi:Domain of unknown function (DUF4190)